MRSWRRLKSEYVFKRRWMNLRVDTVETASGLVLDEYHVIESSDWVCVVALTQADELVLVRQYRHGVGASTLELPAGVLDEGEEPLSAARREFREETGYGADDWTHLISVSPETTRHTHRVHCFLARGARPVAEQTLDETEDVEVSLRPVAELPTLLTEIDHAVHITALLLAERVAGPFTS